MGHESAVQTNYDQQADGYSQFLTTPLGKLERDLFDLCIRDCDGLQVLDLGGGTGLRARDALRAGAAHVDVVDISPEMMGHGQAHERAIGRDRISWYQGDVGQSLAHLPLGRYDMVIANGVLDHARTRAELETMWANAAAYLKPGGRLVVNRNDPHSPAARDGRYGVVFRDVRATPGGVALRYCVPSTTPPLEFDLTVLEEHYSGSLAIPSRFFTDFENVPWEETAVVKEDPEFWALYLQQPILFIITAKKRS